MRSAQGDATAAGQFGHGRKRIALAAVAYWRRSAGGALGLPAEVNLIGLVDQIRALLAMTC